MHLQHHTMPPRFATAQADYSLFPKQALHQQLGDFPIDSQNGPIQDDYRPLTEQQMRERLKGLIIPFATLTTEQKHHAYLPTLNGDIDFEKRPSQDDYRPLTEQQLRERLKGLVIPVATLEPEQKQHAVSSLERDMSIDVENDGRHSYGLGWTEKSCLTTPSPLEGAFAGVALPDDDKKLFASMVSSVTGTLDIDGVTWSEDEQRQVLRSFCGTHKKGTTFDLLMKRTAATMSTKETHHVLRFYHWALANSMFHVRGTGNQAN
ncbi:hypothetical protein R3P38DRAFT_3267054 [Favolaschia claudopus]|uniref:Uncharacterized protein n=1 Tax=Favolaschia claudopus TaxID=2862362 RepID=A0AAW0BQW3_9AGAR